MVVSSWNHSICHCAGVWMTKRILECGCEWSPKMICDNDNCDKQVEMARNLFSGEEFRGKTYAGAWAHVCSDSCAMEIYLKYSADLVEKQKEGDRK